MRFLLDTCTVSELVKPRPDAGVVAWMQDQPDETLCLSAVTVAELTRGVRKLPNGKRRRGLERWLAEQIIGVFADRILAFDHLVGDTWAEIVVESEASGRLLSILDSLIAATAQHHGLTLVTRNERNMPASVAVLNPWSR